MKKRNSESVAENESPYYITIVEQNQQQNTHQNLPLPSPPESMSGEEDYYSYIQSNPAKESPQQHAADTDPAYEYVSPVNLSVSVSEVFQCIDSLNEDDYV